MSIVLTVWIYPYRCFWSDGGGRGEDSGGGCMWCIMDGDI